MADFILNRNRKISVVDPYPFPEGVFQIYGNGRFYNGFSIGDTSSNLSVVNKDGVLKFSHGGWNASQSKTVILGTIPKNNRIFIYIDIASPLSQSMNYNYFEVGGNGLPSEGAWTAAQITRTQSRYSQDLKKGGALSIFFKTSTALPATPDLFAVRAIWVQ